MTFSINQFTLCAIATLLCLSIPSIDGLRILGLFPFQMRSHFVMCEELMRGLAARGHQVDVYSHFPLKKPVPNYRDFSLYGTLPFDVESLIKGPNRIKHWLKTIGTPLCQLLELPIFQKLLHEPPVDPPYDLVINELSVTNCYIPWGRRLNVPVIGVVTPPLIDWQFEPLGTPNNLAFNPSMFSPYVAPMTFLERLHNVIIHHKAKRAFSQYTLDHDEIVEKIFGPDHPNAVDLLKDVALVLVNHDLTLSGIRPFAPLVVPVGGLHVVDHNETLPQEVRAWLDESMQGCIYFSFGSFTRIEKLPKYILESFYKAFKNIAPVRILLKIEKPEELPPGLPSNVMTEPWFQQIQVLKHKNLKAFVTHGGLMGTQESIYYGVPLIGIPLFGDQSFNVQAYVKRKIAIKVELHDISEKTFTNVLKEILNNPEYKKAIDNVSRKFKDRPISPMDTATFWVEYIARYGKDSLKSPISDMPWWQASLLDVYGFITVSILLILYVTMKVIKRLIHLFWPNIHVQLSSKIKKN